MDAAAAIDWQTAQRVGELMAGSAPTGRMPVRSVQPLAHDFARRVSEYTGLELSRELPPLEAVDRPGWIAANLRTMRPLLESMERAKQDANGSRGLLSGPVEAVSGHVLGAQLGAVTGLLSQRVLGQYDISLLDPSATPRLLLLEPNLLAASRTLKVDREQLLAWVAIHEITHAVQFSGAPWLQEHLASLLRELLQGLQVAVGGSSGEPSGEGSAAAGGKDTAGEQGQSGGRFPDPRELLRWAREGELQALIERARHGELLRLTLGEDRWRLVERMQATMSLIEGHAEHTMDAVGAELLPGLPRLRIAMDRRRESRGLPWRVLERLLGLELKMRQYEAGRSFCDHVVEQAGVETLALAWRSPAELPSGQEIAQPAQWLARMSIPA
ncbi:MAG TPA: zinc-dependent metalloprotease [Solirubrobacteraceae bacterium]|nr:zinc-dependent metalloprotease [Solirubrobacteraceae bacterium]